MDWEVSFPKEVFEPETEVEDRKKKETSYILLININLSRVVHSSYCDP